MKLCVYPLQVYMSQDKIHWYPLHVKGSYYLPSARISVKENVLVYRITSCRLICKGAWGYQECQNGHEIILSDTFCIYWNADTFCTCMDCFISWPSQGHLQYKIFFNFTNTICSTENFSCNLYPFWFDLELSFNLKVQLNSAFDMIILTPPPTPVH